MLYKKITWWTAYNSKNKDTVESTDVFEIWTGTASANFPFFGEYYRLFVTNFML